LLLGSILITTEFGLVQRSVFAFDQPETQIVMLAIQVLLVLIGVISASLPTMAGETKVVPILSVFHHWDHHWYIWLPGDPVYEAVEVMSRERAVGAPPLEWVFFTERVAPKRQVQFFNDVQLATFRGGHFREITFAMTGAQGQPRGITVALTDADGDAIAIDLQFAAGAQLVTTGAGLTDQSGHSADRHLLIFFREKNAIAQDRHVVRAGADRAHPQPGQNHPAPWPAAYSSNIFVAVFPFAERDFLFRAGGPPEQGVIRFSTGASQGVAVADLADGTQLELVDSADGRMQFYRHRSSNHVFEISFEPPLPSTGHGARAIASVCRMSLDGFRDLVTGTVRVSQRADVVVLDWLFEMPESSEPVADHRHLQNRQRRADRGPSRP